MQGVGFFCLVGVLGLYDWVTGLSSARVEGSGIWDCLRPRSPLFLGAFFISAEH